jgi:hypothetical protein
MGGRMTELNKRSPELQPVTVPALVVKEYNQLKLENDKLKEQLRWRPVSDELPSVEKDGDAVIARYKDLDEGLVQFGVVSTIWFLLNYESWFTHWLPIPPAQEGIND